MTRSALFLSVAAGAAALLLSPAAHAGLVCGTNSCSETLSYGEPTFTKTNWATNLVFDQFDLAAHGAASLGSVEYTLSGGVSGTASAENRDATPATLTLDLKATITADKPSSVAVVSQIIPLKAFTFDASAYDGTTDFAGTSGTSQTGSANATPVSNFLTAASDIAPFIGTGTISVPVAASGTSLATGAGNIISSFSTQAGAQLTVTYNFTPQKVPEPGSLAILGFAIIGLGFISRKAQNSL